MTFEFRLSPKIIFGSKSVEKIPAEIENTGAKKILLVTDEGLAETEILKKILDLLENLEVTVFSRVAPNPKEPAVEEGLRVAKDRKCEAVLGIGGGSPMDVAKMIAAMMTNSGNIWEYEGADKFRTPPLPLILVPTTAGTGSEVSRAAMITNSVTHRKTLFLSWYLTARTAVLDPELTLGLPQKITVWSGMDALSHAVESYVSNMSNPLTDVFAEKATELIYKNLERAVKNGSDIEARTNMLLGSLMAGISTANARLGNVHALAHAIGGKYDLPHGLLCGALLPVVMKYNLDYCRDKLARMAAIFGLYSEDASTEESAEFAIKLIDGLREKLCLPKKLSEIGVKEDDIPYLVENTVLIPSNPRPTKKEDLFSLYSAAISG
ncbi:MAG: iron-containing alcohol dehydrogenase [Candidatus Hadarchaeales archaeon]